MYELEKVWICKYFEHLIDIIYLCLCQNICYGHSKERSPWLRNKKINSNNYYNYKTNYGNVLIFTTFFLLSDSKKMPFISKMLVRIAKREDPDQIASSETV